MYYNTCTFFFPVINNTLSCLDLTVQLTSSPPPPHPQVSNLKFKMALFPALFHPVARLVLLHLTGYFRLQYNIKVTTEADKNRQESANTHKETKIIKKKTCTQKMLKHFFQVSELLQHSGWYCKDMYIAQTQPDNIYAPFSSIKTL